MKPTLRRFIAFVIERNGKFLVRQRANGVVNGHLWEFPNVEIGARLSEPQQIQTAARMLNVKTSVPEPICTIKHSITRYRITLEAYRATLANSHLPEGKWLKLHQLNKLAFPSAHKKVLSQL